MRVRKVATAATLAMALVLGMGIIPGTLGDGIGEEKQEEDCDAMTPEELKKKAKKMINNGDSALMAKKYRDAIKFYSEATKLEPNNEKHFVKLYKAHERTGNNKAALKDLDKAIKINPDYTTAWSFRGRTLLNLGRCPEAASSFEKVLAIKATHGDAKKLLPKATQCAKEIELAEQFLKQGKYELAEQHCNEAIETTGKAPYVTLLRTQARYHQQKYFEAIADAGEVLKKESDDQDALVFRGMAYYMVADHEMALRHFREGLHKDPEHKLTKAWYKKLQKILKLTKKGDALLAVHNHDSWVEALSIYNEALQVDPQHREHNKVLLTQICKIHTKMKNKQEAQKACDAAIRLDPSVIEPYILYADLLNRIAEETPQFEEALRAWQRAVDVDRDDPRVREGLQKAEVGLKQSKQKNYYKILGVPRDADTGLIKRQYRKLAKEYHPDRHTDKSDEEKDKMNSKFQEIAEAYEVLSDDELRGKYDRGEEVFENQGNQGGGGFHRRHPFGRRGGGGFHFHRGGF